jgi:hypothetical protein
MHVNPDPRPRPAYSIAALCCPPVVLGIIYFLSTQQGRDFNERVFGRYYTLGALLMLGAYGVLVFGLLAAGVAASIAARRRHESPSWMPKLALVVNLVIPIGFLLYRSYF